MKWFLISLILFTLSSNSEGQAEKPPCLEKYFKNAGKFSNFSGGDGSKENPYVICNIHQLQDIHPRYDHRYYILGQNIDASSSHPDHPDFYRHFTSIENFSAELNGNGFEISNLYVKASSDSRVGLFKVVSSGTRIKNLGLKDLTFEIGGAEEIAIGGLAGEIKVNGENSVEITNSYVSGSMTLSGNNNSVYAMGKLIGQINVGKTEDLINKTFFPLSEERSLVQIKQSYVSGSMTFSGNNNSVHAMGKLIGKVKIERASAMEITDSYVEADTVFYSEVENRKNLIKGGLIGIMVAKGNSEFTLRNCFLRGQVNFSSKGGGIANMGGLFGLIDLYESNLEITDSYIEADTVFHVDHARHSGIGKLAGGISVRSGRVKVRNYSVRGQTDFSSKDGWAYIGGLAGRMFITGKSSVEITDSQIEDSMVFGLEDSFTDGRKWRETIEKGGMPAIGGLFGSLSVNTGSHIKIADNDINNSMSFVLKNSPQFLIGGLIGQIKVEGFIEIVDSDVNGFLPSLGDENEDSSLNSKIRGLIGVMNYRGFSYGVYGKNMLQENAYVKIIDSDVKEGMIFSGESNPQSTIGGLVGLLAPTDKYRFGGATKGYLVVTNSYIRDTEEKYPLVNLFYNDQRSCPEQKQWMGIHNSKERYHLVINEEMLPDNCLPKEFDLL